MTLAFEVACATVFALGIIAMLRRWWVVTHCDHDYQPEVFSHGYVCSKCGHEVYEP